MHAYQLCAPCLFRLRMTEVNKEAKAEAKRRTEENENKAITGSGDSDGNNNITSSNENDRKSSRGFSARGRGGRMNRGGGRRNIPDMRKWYVIGLLVDLVRCFLYLIVFQAGILEGIGALLIDQTFSYSTKHSPIPKF